MTDRANADAAPDESAPGWHETVPLWLRNLAALGWRVIAILAFAIVLLAIAGYLWTITASIIVAIVVAAVFAPFVLRLRAGGRSRNAAALGGWAVAILLIGGALVLLVIAFLPYIIDLVQRIRDGVGAFQSEAETLNLPTWATVLVENVIDRVGEIGGDLVGTVVASAAEVGTILILATFLLFFFLRDGDKAWLWFFQALGPDKLDTITTAGDEALAKVGGYLRGTTVLAALTAAANYIFMLVLGVPLALPLALLSFVATYIPYFGGIISTLVILLVTLGALGTGPALVMLVLLGVRTFAISYLVRPYVYGRTVNLHPALVLVVLPIGFTIAGMVGLFAAVPITAVILTVAQSAIDIIQPDESPPLPELVPAWLDRLAQWSWRLLVVIALGAILILVAATVPLVLVPILLALLFTATLQPAVDWLVKRGNGRGKATAVAVGGTTAAIVGVLALAIVVLVDQISEVGDTTESGADSIDESSGGILGLLTDGVDQGVGALVGNVTTVGQELASLGTIVLLGTLLTFYFLRDGSGLWGKLMRHTPAPAAAQMTDSFGSAFKILGGYMTGTAAISFVGALSQWVIMVILGLPLALPVFVLSFFGGFIPYIGSLLTTGLAFLIAVHAGDTIDIIVMAIWTVVFNLVQGNIVAPLVYNRTTNIHPAIVLVAIPAGGTIAGILGMIAVIPVIGFVAATWRTVLHVISDPDDPVPVKPPDADDDPQGAGTKPTTEPAADPS